MSRSPSTFRQQDVTRALKATVAAGVKVSRIEIDRAGKIVLVTADAKRQDTESNEWDAPE